MLIDNNSTSDIMKRKLIARGYIFMKEKIRTIDLKQYVKYVLEKLYIVIPFTLICMALLVAMNYKEQEKTVENSKKDILNKVMSQNHQAYYVKDVRYTDAEPPKGVYNSIAAIYVEYNLDDLGQNGSSDVASYVSRVGSDYLSVLVNLDTLEEIIDELDLRKYPEFSNLTAERFKWMINKNFQGAHIINLVVSDVDPERAKLIGDMLIEKFQKNIMTYESVESVTVLSQPNVPGDKGLFSTSTDTVQTGISKTTIIKYAIVGGLLGVCLIAAVLFVVFIICDSARTGNDLAFAEIMQLVNVNRKDVDYKRIAYSINNEASEKKKVLFVSVDSRIDAEIVAEAVKDELKSVNKELVIDSANDFIHKADALAKIAENDAVVYLVKYGKTRMRDLIDAKNGLERTNAQCLGGIIL